jgi:CBS domain containing-hemolysin-like protein
MAKHLGLVPIPGSQVVAHGLRFTAEDTAGRRNKIGTVRIARVEPAPGSAGELSHAKEAVRD